MPRQLSGLVLTVVNIQDRGFQTLRIVDEPLTAAFGPPVLANGFLANASGWCGGVRIRSLTDASGGCRGVGY